MTNDQERQIERAMREHLPNAAGIIKELARLQICNNRDEAPPAYLHLPGTQPYQRYIFEKFADVIATPSTDYVSKTEGGWLVVGDNRLVIASQISLIIERFGLGVGMLVLHAQQMNAGHIPLTVNIEGGSSDMTLPTQSLYGVRNEHVINVPIRKYRADNQKLAELNIMKPEGLWNRSRIVRHRGDKFDCRYCSAGEMNPLEVVVNVKGSRLGLSRNYSLGFTFAPFGNPLTVVHFLAWDHAEKPLNMNRTPVTVSDLVVLTGLINTSIMNFFTGTGIEDFPVIDGVSNGWAGNSIYHQHFQFFQPEFPPTIENKALVCPLAILERDDVRIHRLSWGLPIYKMVADESINVGLVGNDLAGVWRLQSDVKVVSPLAPDTHDGFEAEAGTEMRFHTQNLYVPGNYLGKVAYIALRDRRLVDYIPDGHAFVNRRQHRLAQRKSNIGVLEISGTIIADDIKSFAEMNGWEPADISAQVDYLTAAVCPKQKKIEQFEASIRGLFPPE